MDSIQVSVQAHQVHTNLKIIFSIMQEPALLVYFTLYLYQVHLIQEPTLVRTRISVWHQATKWPI